MMRGAVRVGIATSLLIAGSAPARAAELQARGPAECPDGMELAFRVERNAQVTLALAPAVRFDVAMERAAAGYVAHVRMTGAGAHETKERLLSGASCAELGDAIVVAVTLALGAVEPAPATPAPSEAPASARELAPSAQAVSADAPPLPSASDGSSGGLRPSLSLSALVDVGSLPAAGAGAALQAGVGWGRFELRALGLLLLWRSDRGWW
jgi:hypothetical protein